MEIKMIRLADIKPYENNPRLNDDAVEPVKESIKRYGFKVPMILDQNNIIVTGHTRYKAAQALGMDEVPVIYADDLTEEQIKEFRLVDNKTAEFAQWDFSKLEAELDGLDFGDFDFGFELSDGGQMIPNYQKTITTKNRQNSRAHRQAICTSWETIALSAETARMLRLLIGLWMG